MQRRRGGACSKMLTVDIKEMVCDVEQIYIDFNPAILACSVHARPIFKSHSVGTLNISAPGRLRLNYSGCFEMTAETDPTSSFMTGKSTLNYVIFDSGPMMA